MSPGVEFKITGFEETLRLLEDAPKQIVLLGYGRAARAGINVVAAELARRTPVRTGKLVKSLKTAVKVYAENADSQNISAIGVKASVGFSGKEATVANALEYGRSVVTRSGRVTGFVHAYPFMRPAFDASADAAVDAFASELESALS